MYVVIRDIVLSNYILPIIGIVIQLFNLIVLYTSIIQH